MNIDKITKQYNKALEIKKGDKYAETLKLELSKQEWQDELNAIEERISNILTKKILKNAQSNLNSYLILCMKNDSSRVRCICVMG